MIKFKSFILEGGNVKIGETSASPIKVTSANRTQRQADIHGALSDLHNSFHAQHGEHLFGQGHKALNTHSAYSGSTKDLMSPNISHEEFAKHKPTTGDVDVQIPHEHGQNLASHLSPGKKFGKYTVVGTKKHGNEISAIMKHDNGEHHQFDFEKTNYENNEPTKGEQFLHSSNWKDTKAGIKGVHHKVLLNTAGGDTHKFSITHGLRSRHDEKEPGVTNPEHVSKVLFGPNADHNQIHSFIGVSNLIKKHVPAEHHQAIYDRFKGSLKSRASGINHGPALSHLRKTLGVHDEELGESYKLNEDTEQHAHVAFMGASPHTHMGHHIDVVGSMGHGNKFVGLSGKSDSFSDKEREDIANRQSGGNAQFKVEKSAGQTVGRAFHSLNGNGKKILHLHFGHDRKAMAELLKDSIESDKIPELQGHKPDEVRIHYPKDENRSHGMSGTKVRTAAENNDLNTYKHHLGSNFSDKEAKGIMNRTRIGLMAGKIKIKR